MKLVRVCFFLVLCPNQEKIKKKTENQIKKKTSQLKHIVCFAKPTKTQNTFFVSRGIFSDTKRIVCESQISQASVFIY